MKNQPSDKTQGMTRRRVLARIGEAAAALPLFALGFKTLLDKSTYYGLEKTVAHAVGPAQDDILKLRGAAANVATSADNLDGAYHGAYRKSRMVYKPSMNMDGEMEMRLKTERYWDEPKMSPGHSVIGNFKNPYKNFASRAGELLGNSTLSWEDSPASVEKKDTSKVALALAGGGGYIALISALTWYEELLNKMNGYNHNHRPARRSLLKLLTIGGASAFIYDRQQEASEDLERGKSRLEKKIKDLRQSIQSTDDQAAFNNFFGGSPSYFLKKSVNDYDTIAPLTKVKDENVKAAAKRTLGSIDDFSEAVQSHTGKISPDFARTLKYAKATEELTKAVNEERTSAGAAPFKDLGIIALIGFGVLAPYEFYNAHEIRRQNA